MATRKTPAASEPEKTPVSASGEVAAEPEEATAAMEAQDENPPAGATATAEDFEEGQAAAAQSAAPDPSSCANCGKPATWRAKGSGAEPTGFCDACAAAVYPTDIERYLERVDASNK